jgi:capsular exopolysaccharide synthesis family protein
MADNDLGKAVSETIELYYLESDGEKNGGDAIANVDKSHIDQRLVVYHHPRSVESEYFRFLKSRIEQEFGRSGKAESRSGKADSRSGKTEKGKVIMITGPNLAAGKTTLSINLALAFARTHGGKTLFMDVDSRRGTSREYLGIREDGLPGFTDVLNLKKKAGQVMINSGMFDMVYFPSGQFNEKFLDSLGGKEMGVLMENLRKKFKYIIIDAPPAFPMPEPAVLATHCDGVFIVLRAGRDGKEDLNQALEALEGAHIMGVILNATKKTPGQRYGALGYYGKRS